VVRIVREGAEVAKSEEEGRVAAVWAVAEKVVDEAAARVEATEVGRVK
jgi:hypothetical protein